MLPTCLDPDGLWREASADLAWAKGRPALFLDRDGVVVEEVNFLCRVDDVALIPGAAPLIAEANRRRIPVAIASNQAGIARGYFGWAEFAAVQQCIQERLLREGAHIDLALACPHDSDHPDRKPAPGMFLKAAAMAGLDLKRSWMIGDRTGDLQAARAAGLRGAVLVLTGYGKRHREESLALHGPEFTAREADSIAEAAWVLDELSRR